MDTLNAEPTAKRVVHCYGVGAAKTGTSSIAACFQRRLRAAHEPESRETIDVILALAGGALSRDDLRRYLVERDHRLQLDVDSSQLNYFFVRELVSLFPQAKFILTIREPQAWLESFINHQLSRTVSDRWRRLRELRFRHPELVHPREESPLQRRGLYTLDGYLSYWRAHNDGVLAAAPAERLLVVRTDFISRQLRDVAQFVGCDDAADAAGAHANRAETKHPVLAELDPAYVAAKIEAWCGPLLRRFFPEIDHGRLSTVLASAE